MNPIMSADPVAVTALRLDDALLSLANIPVFDPDAEQRLIDAVVERFAEISHAERCKFAKSLYAIAAVLQNQIKFVPRIFDRHIKVRVSDDAEAARVQEKLFSWGCGFHNGSYPLKQCVELANRRIYSIHVSPTGCIGFNFDAHWYEKSNAHEVQADTVLDADAPPHPYTRTHPSAQPA